MSDIGAKLPKDYLERMKVELGENYERYLLSLEKSSVRGLRVNTKRISVPDFLNQTKLPLKKIDFADDGFYFLTEQKIGNDAEHLTGQIYLQEPSSMLAVIASQIENERGSVKVLDLCASPGGKTSQIACRVSDDSVIFSNEIIPSRASVLFSNIERQGFKNVVVLNEKPENLAGFENHFDYVFVDAPCSGEGMFRKNPETIAEWSEDNVKMCAERQKEILSYAEKLVKGGGKLIYSTCTFSMEEDEEVVDWFAKNYNFKLVDISEEIKKVTLPSKARVEGGENARKFYPFFSDGEGQFIAVFEKYGEKQETSIDTHGIHNIKLAGKTELKIVSEFMQKNLIKMPNQKVVQVGESFFLAPIGFEENERKILDNLKFVSIGVKLGVIQKGRFEPSHTLFMACPEMFKLKIELDEQELKRYLHGEELNKDIGQNLFAVVTHGGFPLGGVKVVANRLKNLYPKGLRL